VASSCAVGYQKVSPKNSLQCPDLAAKGGAMLYMNMSLVERNKAECGAMCILNKIVMGIGMVDDKLKRI
jgi:hypothetical protein